MKYCFISRHIINPQNIIFYLIIDSILGAKTKRIVVSCNVVCLEKNGRINNQI